MHLNPLADSVEISHPCRVTSVAQASLLIQVGFCESLAVLFYFTPCLWATSQPIPPSPWGEVENGIALDHAHDTKARPLVQYKFPRTHGLSAPVSFIMNKMNGVEICTASRMLFLEMYTEFLSVLDRPSNSLAGTPSPILEFAGVAPAFPASKCRNLHGVSADLGYKHAGTQIRLRTVKPVVKGLC